VDWILCTKLLGVLYELDEGFGTMVVVYDQTLRFGDSNMFKVCSYGLIDETD